MSERLHPITYQYLTMLSSDHPNSDPVIAWIQNLIKTKFYDDRGDAKKFLEKIKESMSSGFKIEGRERRFLDSEVKVKKKQSFKKLDKLRQIILEKLHFVFPDHYQFCAFLLLIKFKNDNEFELLDCLSVDPVFFGFKFDSNSGGIDPDDRIDIDLGIDWCPNSILTDPDILHHLSKIDKVVEYDFELWSLDYLYKIFISLEGKRVGILDENPKVIIDENSYLNGITNLKTWVQDQLVQHLLSLEEKNSLYEFEEIIDALPVSARQYEEVMRHILSIDGTQLRYMNDAIKTRKDIVTIAVQNNGNALTYASEGLRHDADLIKIALENTPVVLCRLPETIRNNPEWVRIAVSNDPKVLTEISLEYFDENIQFEIWRDAISRLPIIIQLVPNIIRITYPQLFQLAYDIDKRTIIFAAPHNAISESEIKLALEEEPLLFPHMPVEVRTNPEILSIVIQKEPLLSRYIPITDENRVELSTIALDANPIAFLGIYQHTIPHVSQIQSIIETDPLIIPADFVTLNYATEEMLIEKFLQALLSRDERDMLDVKELEFIFREKEFDFELSLFHLTPDKGSLIDELDF